ncbi:polysaccharide deacetylase family protein [Candidatus Saccharibacteria bacterium]|nr:polysaccharide deacetylase family protein [Candidatus Saccharibacteria bacterium]
MNLLDKLFSREIERRTGAHAIVICIEENKAKKRSRSLGASALKASSRTKITTKKTEGSFFHRLDLRFPWLKLVAVILIGVIVILDLLNLTISSTGEQGSRACLAPMSKHVKATDRVLTGKKLVVLTFDDGPSNVTTPHLLDILREKDVPATFFVLGNKAQASPKIIKRAIKEGHEVASHTMYHQNLIRIPANAAKNDINEARSTLAGILGFNPRFTRPPYGNINNVIREVVGTPMILWSVDTEDWRSKDTDSIISTAMSELHDGAIILMHDIYPTTVEAVPKLIDGIRKQGYEFASLSELTKIRHVELKNGVAYYSFRP